MHLHKALFFLDRRYGAGGNLRGYPWLVFKESVGPTGGERAMARDDHACCLVHSAGGGVTSSNLMPGGYKLPGLWRCLGCGANGASQRAVG